MYTINHLQNPKSFLRKDFYKYKNAVTAAIRASYDDCVWTIICDDEIIAIVYQQSLYELTETAE